MVTSDIKFGRRRFVSPHSLLVGDLIEFGYNGKVRTAVVVSPDWKGNVDCYVFDSLEDAKEILSYILEQIDVFRSGDLYVDFGTRFQFKSFSPSKMGGAQRIEYGSDQSEPIKTVDPDPQQLEVFDMYGE